MSTPVVPPRTQGIAFLEPLERSRALAQALRSPECYFHPAADVRLLETHISYVLLAGPFAYKIKKPVKLHFLDYSTPQLRRHYCEEEARLNARTAPELYLGVVPIAGTLQHPVVGGSGVALEYAVRTRRFREEDKLDRLAASDRLEARHVDGLALQVARLHQEAKRTGPGLAFGEPEEALRCALDNFRSIQMLEQGTGRSSIPRRLHDWTLAEHAAIRDVIRERQLSGFVRECHGDLHLGNVVLLAGEPVIFDCIEYNAGFRWIDVMNDLAFAVMDLHYHGRADLAARLVNEYLERTDDYAGLRVLRFYCVYRAMVRAKVACIRAFQPGLAAHEREGTERAFLEYVALATRLSESAASAVILLHGVSGSGKTVLSRSLVELLGAVRVRSDVVRRRLEPGGDLYSEASRDRAYVQLAARAAAIASAGYPAIADATFLEAAHRTRFRELADARRVPFAIVECVAPEPVLRERVASRAAKGDDASEADLRVLEAQLAHGEPLCAAERDVSVCCNTTAPEAASLAAELLARRISPGPARR